MTYYPKKKYSFLIGRQVLVKNQPRSIETSPVNASFFVPKFRKKQNYLYGFACRQSLQVFFDLMQSVIGPQPAPWVEGRRYQW